MQFKQTLSFVIAALVVSNSVFARPEASSLTTRDDASVDASTGPVCQGGSLNADDVGQATNALANFFGSGTTFNSKSVSQFSSDKSVAAYGCNYGNGQTMSSGEFLGYMQVLKAKCSNSDGSLQEAYYDLPSSKSSYGYTSGSNGFC